MIDLFKVSFLNWYKIAVVGIHVAEGGEGAAEGEVHGPGSPPEARDWGAEGKEFATDKSYWRTTRGKSKILKKSCRTSGLARKRVAWEARLFTWLWYYPHPPESQGADVLRGNFGSKAGKRTKLQRNFEKSHAQEHAELLWKLRAGLMIQHAV